MGPRSLAEAARPDERVPALRLGVQGQNFGVCVRGLGGGKGGTDWECVVEPRSISEFEGRRPSDSCVAFRRRPQDWISKVL